MWRAIYLFLFIPFSSLAHPGVGIVIDSKGIIYYTDLQHVWKIKGGKKSVAVANVHTHELFVDQHDNLYGEGGEYKPGNPEKFYHYLWVLHPDGKLETAVSLTQQYIKHDFTLARDKHGNEYFTKEHTLSRDTNHIYKKTPDGKENVLATGNFKGIKYLHPQADGSILYGLSNSIYRIDSTGNITTVATDVADAKPTFSFSKSPALWGVWQDKYKAVYVAAFSDQSVKKITPDGKIAVIYKSSEKWTPIHGVFDNSNRLWVMETSDKNEIRVVETFNEKTINKKKEKFNLLYIIIPIIVLLVIVLIVRPLRHFKYKRNESHA